jgi:hypothetical protein
MAAQPVIDDFVERLTASPRPAWPLAFARISIGLILIAWTVTWMFDASTLLSPTGPVGVDAASDDFRWIPLESMAGAWFALIALLICAIAIVVGWRPTIWLLVAFVLLVSIQRRDPVVLNSGDLILRNLTLLLALTPTGAALSVDRWRAHGRSALRTSPLVAPWGMRLVQLQIMVVYLFAFLGKRGDTWWDGTAVSTALRLEDLERFPAPEPFISNVTIVAALTWGTLIVELALGTLLWARRLRPLLIALAVLLHIGVDMFLLVGFFGVTMIAGLTTFLDADWIDRRIRRRWPTDTDAESVASTDPPTTEHATDDDGDRSDEEAADADLAAHRT